MKKNGESPVGRLPVALAACAILAGCAAGPHGERAQLAAPTSVSEVYSEANLRMVLASAPDAAACLEAECAGRVEFDQRVTRMGTRLAVAAYHAYPELSGRVPAFQFSVVDKNEPGTASTAGGRVIVLRPVGTLAREDHALSFVIAREMGHIVGQHHEENTAFSILSSVVATVVAPVVNFARLLSTFYSGATSMAASAALTAGSFAGSRVLIESYRPKQREEADEIALKLIASFGYEPKAVAAGFSQTLLKDPASRWVRELSASVERLAARGGSAPMASLPALFDKVVRAEPRALD